MSRRRFFVDCFRDGFAELAGDDARHLARVLRAEPGQRFELSDNRSVQLAEVAEVSPRRVRFRLIETVAEAAPVARVVLVAALIKFDRFEWLVEKATELGVTEIVPVEAERTERGLLAAAGSRVERWRRIARESSQQARRVTMPLIADPQPLARVETGRFGLRYRLEEDRTSQTLVEALPEKAPPEEVAMLVGPEGGWTDSERARLAAEWTPVSLGGQILRAETAAIAGLAVVMNVWAHGPTES